MDSWLVRINHVGMKMFQQQIKKLKQKTITILMKL